MKLLLTLALFIAVPALAAQPDCLVEFFNLSADAEDRDKLIVQTYRELLETLNGDTLSPAAIEKMIADKTPLTVPETEESTSLRKRMREFQQMLEKAGWESPAANELMLQNLGEYRDAIAVQRAALKRAIRRDMNDIVIDFPHHTEQIYSPDGKWILNFARTTSTTVKGQTPYSVYDVENRTLREFQRPSTWDSPLRFSGDGKSLLFKKGTGVDVVPFENGEAKWDRGENALHNRTTTTAWNDLTPTNLPDVYFAGQHNGMAVFFNLKQNGVHARSLYKLEPGERYHDAGWFPGQGRFFLVKGSAAAPKLLVVSQKQVGQIHLENESRLVPTAGGNALKLHPSADGNWLIAGGNSTSTRLHVAPTLGDAPFEPVQPFAGGPEFPGKLIHVLPLPNSNQAIVTYAAPPPGSKIKLELIDFVSKKSLAVGDLPPLIGDPRVSADGEWIYYQTPTDPKKVFARHLDAAFPTR